MTEIATDDSYNNLFAKFDCFGLIRDFSFKISQIQKQNLELLYQFSVQISAQAMQHKCYDCN